MEIDEKLKLTPFISKTSLASALRKKNVRTLNSFIRYWMKKKTLIRVKRGFFVWRDFLERDNNAFGYPRFLATKMVEPSYLSGEFILQDYQILTDVVFNYSIITTKKTLSIKNDFGLFNYQSIKPELFFGFRKKTSGNMIWYEASKAKALFDFLYFNRRKFTDFSRKEISDLRLKLEPFTAGDWREFESYLKFSPEKMQNIYQSLKKYAF